jgi:ParB-like nuclease domain
MATPSGDPQSAPSTRFAATRQAIRAALEADPAETNTSIAKRLKTSRDTVISVRKEIAQAPSPSREQPTMKNTDPDGVDVFALPVHPWAAMFPMRTDEDLDAMAQSIKTNGLRMPVVLGMSIIEADSKPVLCVVDGRNRIEACKRAGVKPHTIMLNGEDQDAFIADANLERRDLTKGQKAMLVAARFPDPNKRGRGNKSTVSDDFNVSETRIKTARAVRKYCSEMVPQIIDGSKSLDEAYAEARLRQAAQQSHETRFNELASQAPDLAELVREERISISNAESELRDRAEKAANELRSAIALVHEIGNRMGSFAGVHGAKLIANYRAHGESFKTQDFRADLDYWIGILSDLRKELGDE